MLICTVPLDRPGLGWLLAGLGGLGAVLATTRRTAWSAGRIGSAVAVVLLLGAGTVRAAGWLFVLCVLVALPFASLAVAGGGGTWGRLARGATALPLAVPAAVTRTVHSGVGPLRRGRQLATGTIAGLILVVWARAPLNAIVTQKFPTVTQLRLDVPVLIFAVIASIV